MTKESIKQVLVVAVVLVLVTAALSDEIIVWVLKIQGEVSFIDMPR